eukprot:5199499-Alexandrium_andersonii.AAC.1
MSPERLLLDSGAARSACPRHFAENYEIRPTATVEMTSAQGDRVGHYGETEVTLQEVSTGKLAKIHLSLIHI